MTESLHTPDRREDVDGLRAIAVVAVLIFHAFPTALPGGFIGVDVFFVISGYVITLGLIERLGQNRFSIADFYSRRIRRIFPALLVVLCVSAIVGYYLLLPDELQQFGMHLIGAATFSSNYVLWREDGYFDTPSATKPLLHLWSLGIEEQFYIVWPLMIWAGWRWRHKLNLFWIIVGVTAISFYLNIIRQNPVADFYSPLTRFWELSVGGALATGYIKRPRSQVLINAISYAGVILLIAGMVIIQPVWKFPGWVGLLPVAGSAALIFAGPSAHFNRSVLSLRTMQGIGFISYPLYLWHWPLLSFAHIFTGKPPTALPAVALLLLAFLLAYATYRWIEIPLRVPAPRRRTLVTALAGSMVAVMALGSVGVLMKGFPDRSFMAAWSKPYSQLVGSLWPYENNETCLSRYPFSQAKNYKWWFCTTNRNADPTLLLLGNSYANQLFPGFAHNEHFSGQTILSIGTCDPGWTNSNNESSPLSSSCAGPNRLLQQTYINGLVERYASLKYAIIDGLVPTPTPAYIETIARRVSYLQDHGVTVIIFTPHLRPDFEIKRCLGRNFVAPLQSCDFPMSVREQRTKDFAPLVTALKASNPKTLFFDQNAVFCGANGCSYLQSGMPMYRDRFQHLSEFASEQVAARFAEWARVNVPALVAMPQENSDAAKQSPVEASAAPKPLTADP